MNIQTRIGVLFAATGLALLVLVGCSETTPEASAPPAPTVEPTPGPYPFTVTGSGGKTITFDEAPERIVAIDSSVVETLFVLGEGWRIAGTHDFVTYPPESKDIPKVGGGFALNLEATVELDPDLVFVFSKGQVDEMERLGLRVLFMESLNDDFRRVADNIRMWGRIVDSREAAEEVASDFEARIAGLEALMADRPAGPKVFQDEGSLWTPGPDTMIGRVFDLLKLQNIASDVEGYAVINPEVIVERRPDIVVASYQDEISSNPAFAGLPAVLNGRIFVPPADLLVIPGPRYIDGMEALAEWVYPELFE